MSDPENFIARWSRRKRQGDLAKGGERLAQGERAAQVAEAKSSPQTTARDRAEPGQATVATNLAAEKVPFDVASLPPLESITAESDIRAFLAPGVPMELTRAALRRAWSADPRIRDFVGLAENSWDFNTPGAISGFGTLEITDELRREVARMVGRSLGAEGRDSPDPQSAAALEVLDEHPSVETTGESDATTGATPIAQSQSIEGISQDQPMSDKIELYNSNTELPHPQNNTAPQYLPEKPDDVPPLVKRPHGRALPK